MKNSLAITKHVVALVMALIMLVLLPVNAFALDLSYETCVDSSNFKTRHYLSSDLFTYGGNLPSLRTADFEGYFSSHRGDDFIASFMDARSLAYISDFLSYGFTDYITYKTEQNEYKIICFKRISGAHISTVSYYDGQFHFQHMGSADYFLSGGIKNNGLRYYGSSVVTVGNSNLYIVQNIQYGGYDSFDSTTMSGAINAPNITILNSSVTVNGANGEDPAFELDGTSDADPDQDRTDYPELSDNVYQDPHEGEQAPSFPSVSDYDNIFDFMKHFLPDAFRWLGQYLVWYLSEIRYYLAYIVERLHSMLVYFRSLFVVLTNNIDVMFNNLSNDLVRYINTIIVRMNYLNGRIITSLSNIKSSIDSLNGSSGSSSGSTSMSVTLNMDDTNDKLDTINSTLGGLGTINDSIRSVGASLTSLSNTIREAIFSVTNASDGVFEEGYNFANGLVQIITKGVSQQLIPNSDNINSIIREKVPAVEQVENAFSYDENEHFNTVVSFSFKMFDENYAYYDDVSDISEFSFGIGDIPSGLRQGIYDMTTLVAYVLRFFLIIKIFFKAFDVKIASEGGDD